jgi:hypothetical protein
MMRLNKIKFDQAVQFIKEHAEGPDKALFSYHFERGGMERVVEELSAFQNEDGGFGALEYDIDMPDSSAIATVRAFQYFIQTEAGSDQNAVQDGIRYFTETCRRNLLMWHAVPPRIREVPHAPWWSYTQLSDMELSWEQKLARYSPNTNVEVVAYLLRYRDLVPDTFPLEACARIAVEKLAHLPDIEMHEFSCYLQLYEALDDEQKRFTAKKLLASVQHVIEPDEGKWSGYAAQPITFVESPSSLVAKCMREDVERNLDYLIRIQNEDGSWSPNWSWGQPSYEQAWKRAKRKWQGYITVQNLIKLRAFDRIDGI